MMNEHDIRARARLIAPHDLAGLQALARDLTRSGIPPSRRFALCYNITMPRELLAVWQVEDALGMGVELLTPFELITDTEPEKQARLLLHRRFVSVAEESALCARMPWLLPLVARRVDKGWMPLRDVPMLWAYDRRALAADGASPVLGLFSLHDETPRPYTPSLIDAFAQLVRSAQARCRAMAAYDQDDGFLDPIEEYEEVITSLRAAEARLSR
jgi:hypothetical protein